MRYRRCSFKNRLWAICIFLVISGSDIHTYTESWIHHLTKVVGRSSQNSLSFLFSVKGCVVGSQKKENQANPGNAFDQTNLMMERDGEKQD
jgi:hypothetical protein